MPAIAVIVATDAKTGALTTVGDPGLLSERKEAFRGLISEGVPGVKELRLLSSVGGIVKRRRLKEVEEEKPKRRSRRDQD